MARKSSDEKKDSSAPPPPPAYPYPPNMGPTFPLREKQDGPTMTPLGAGQPRRLHILGATWGGIVVTPQIAAMVSEKNEVVVNMHDLQHIIAPDPAFGMEKSLTVLYQFDGQEGPSLVNINEGRPTRAFTIDGNFHESVLSRSGVHPRALFPAVEQLPMPWRSSAFLGTDNAQVPGVEILSVSYGPKRISTPKVLQDLGEFFEGRRGQIRMNNAFFMEDPDRGNNKSWTVFFRFGPLGRVQVVTGWENGALEVPWSRWA